MVHPLGTENPVVDAELHDALSLHDVLVKEELMVSIKSFAANSLSSGTKSKMWVGPIWTRICGICMDQISLGTIGTRTLGSIAS